MKIAIDLRGLQNGLISGVENYILNLLEHLIPADSANSFILLTNSYRSSGFSHLKFINTTTVSGRIPNRLLNLSLKAFNYPKFEKLFQPFDCLFLPNFNQFAIAPATKLVITVHDLSPIVTPEFYDSRRRLWHIFVNIKKSLERANSIIAVSEFTKQELIRIYSLPPDKITVTPLGVQQTLFRPDLPAAGLRRTRNIYGLPSNFLLFIGTLEPRKNIPMLVRAFERLDDDVDLVIAGRQGWKYKTILNLIANSPKRGRIKYIGYIEEEHKPYLLKLAKALVWPSLYEGFGLPPIEAMSVGTPVITSQVTSLPETVAKAAVMVDPYSIPDLARATSILLNDQAVRENLVEQGYLQAKKFGWERTAEKTREVFNNLSNQ